MKAEEHSERLITGLREAGNFGHAAGEVELIETHISWVLLAGEFAYKVKKPLRFDFLDFSTLEKRRFFCGEELRLNRRFAPDLYLEVVPVTGELDHPVIGGRGGVLDYAVKMRRFAQEAVLSEVAKRGELGGEEVDALARVVADIHGKCARSDPDHDFGRPDDVHFWVLDNFTETGPLLDSQSERDVLHELEGWSAGAFDRLRETLERRRCDGFVRECHGDLHLRNIVLREGEPVLFDCIEFNEALRWIDVMSEVAFLVMDLDDRGFPALGHRFLNRYLQATGDYAGVAVLDYYLVYRAMVRAKVAAIRNREGHLRAGEEVALWEEYRSYVEHARRYMKRPAPVLVLMHGASGSGKSTLAGQLVEREGMIQVRSDTERRRLFGLESAEQSGSGVGAGLYSPAADAAVYDHLQMVARELLAAKRAVLLDATFLKRAQRKPFLDLAGEMNVAVVILDLSAPVEVLRRRIERRREERRDPSEATVEVLDHQLQGREPFDSREEAVRIAIDSSGGIDAGAVAAAVARVAEGQS